LVTRRSKKQGVVARSNGKTEFRAMVQGICEGLWIHRALIIAKTSFEHLIAKLGMIEVYAPTFFWGGGLKYFIIIFSIPKITL